MNINTPTAASIVAVAVVIGAVVAIAANSPMIAASLITLGISLAAALGGRNNSGGATPSNGE